MGEQPALTLFDRFPAVRRLGEPVIGARDHVQALGVAGAIEEDAPMRGRHHLVALGLDDEEARDARGRVGMGAAPGLGDQGRARFARTGGGQLAPQQQVLVAVLGGAHAVTGDHAGARELVGQVKHAGHVGGADGHREAQFAHAQTMSKTRQVLTVSWYIASSTGSCLIFATSSATRATSHGPEVTFSNSPWYCQGASLSTSSDSIGTRSTISRSRAR